MPKVAGIEKIEDEDDVADKILKASLHTTIYKEDVRLIIAADKFKCSPNKGAASKTSPQTKKAGGAAPFSMGKPKMGGGFGGTKKALAKPKATSSSEPVKDEIGAE